MQPKTLTRTVHSRIGEHPTLVCPHFCPLKAEEYLSSSPKMDVVLIEFIQKTGFREWLTTPLDIYAIPQTEL